MLNAIFVIDHLDLGINFIFCFDSDSEDSQHIQLLHWHPQYFLYFPFPFLRYVKCELDDFGGLIGIVFDFWAVAYGGYGIDDGFIS
jgi:hypothetical protein